MANEVRVYRLNPTAGVLTAFPAVPAGKKWHVSKITVCNRTGTETSFRVTTAPTTGTADDPAHDLFTAEPLPGYRTFRTFDFLAEAGNEVRALAPAGGVTFVMFCLENDVAV